MQGFKMPFSEKISKKIRTKALEMKRDYPRIVRNRVFMNIPSFLGSRKRNLESLRKICCCILLDNVVYSYLYK